MKHLPILVIITAFSGIAYPQEHSDGTSGGETQILGRCTRNDFTRDPFREWFMDYYDNYRPVSAVVESLRGSPITELQFRIFFGTWCGDSKREVPRFLKILDQLNISESALELIGVGNSDTLYKRSPGGEEVGKDIFRVPTFIVMKDGREINRIVEYPVTSLERDLLKIVGDSTYSPNYQGYPIITNWLDQGILVDGNVSLRGLANQLRNHVMDVYEVLSCGYVLLQRGDIYDALSLFRINQILYPDESWSYASLAEGLRRSGDNQKALGMIDKALDLCGDCESRERFLKIKTRIKGN